MDESTIDREAMVQLANALAIICGADHPTVAAMKKAVASGTERDIKNARTLLKLKPSPSTAQRLAIVLPSYNARCAPVVQSSCLEAPMFEQTAYGNALAAGTILIALIDCLIDKGLITRSDAQGVLKSAAADLKKETTVAAAEATAVIAKLVGRYA
jgi:hypothetical protein